MNASLNQRRTWRFPKLILEDQIALALMLWVGLVLSVAVAAFGIDRFNEVTFSVWDVISSISSWYVAFFCGYLIYQTFPMFVAHGRSRRDSLIEGLIFTVIFGFVIALLMLVGYGLEHLLYDQMNWTRGAPDSHLYSSYGDIPALFAELWSSNLVWGTTGAFIGVSIYRYPSAGWLSIIPAIALVSLTGSGEGSTFMGFIFNRIPSLETSSILVLAVLTLSCSAISSGLAWRIARGMPLHNK